jgi:tetratricopeptide (TPR) repeat protein
MAGDRGAEAHARRLELLDRLDRPGSGGQDAAGALLEIGTLYRQGGETEKAVAFFLRATAANPARPAAWLGLAGACSDAARYPDAVDALERGLERQPGPQDARAMRTELGLLKTRLETVEARPAVEGLARRAGS